MPDETLAANLIVEDGTVLMLHRRDKDYWELPAGKVEDGEMPRDAARREAREEIGCEVRILSSYGRLDIDFAHEGTDYRVRAFIAAVVDGEPAPVEDRFDELRWMDADDVAAATLAPNLAATEEGLRLLLLRDGQGVRS